MEATEATLKTLKIVAETGSLASAAQRLHRTRLEVRDCIEDLEEALGCRLINRLGGRIVTTQAGEVMLGHASSIPRGRRQRGNGSTIGR